MSARQGHMYEAGDRQGIWTENGFVSPENGVLRLQTWDEFSQGQDVRETDLVPAFAPSFIAALALEAVGQPGGVTHVIQCYKPDTRFFHKKEISTLLTGALLSLGVATVFCFVMAATVLRV